MNIQLAIIECNRRELELEATRQHYARMVRREREKRKALLALLDKIARRGAEGGVCEANRNGANLARAGREVKGGVR